MAAAKYPTHERLKELFRYEAETGHFFRLKTTNNNGARAGTIAGCDDHRGYLLIMIDGVLYKAHRLAWFYVYGDPPAKAIDHINGKKSDNRICNLREATKSQNMQNTNKRRDNTSGHKGVTWNSKCQKWQAQIWHLCKRHYLGVFINPMDAANAYDAAALKLHGEFASVNGCQREAHINPN